MKIWIYSGKNPHLFHCLPIAIWLQKGFAEKCQFHVLANLGYFEAIKCNYEAKNRRFEPIFSRIKSHLIFWQLKFIILSRKLSCRHSRTSPRSVGDVCKCIEFFLLFFECVRFRDFDNFKQKENTAVTLRSIVFIYPASTACCDPSVG